jgi:hypothetical protein
VGCDSVSCGGSGAVGVIHRTIKPAEPETPRQVKMMEVIEVRAIRGNGIDVPVRIVVQYWSKEGKLLAEKDEYMEEKK